MPDPNADIEQVEAIETAMKAAFPLTPGATPVVTPEPPAPAAVPAPTETVAPVKLPMTLNLNCPQSRGSPRMRNC